jgi:glycosyltransferase involved in cell wall biosynthesis
MKRNIVWYCPNLNHYQQYLFEKLNEQSDINLEVVFFHKFMKKYPWQNNNNEFKVSHRYLNKNKLKLDLSEIFRFKDKNITYIIAGWSEPTMIFILTFFAVFRYNYIINTDTPKERKINNLKQLLRKTWLHFILGRSKGVLVTGDFGRKLIEAWGIKNLKVVNFPFVTDNEFFKPAPFKNKTLNIFSSGRLDIAHKGYDVALKAISEVKKLHPDIHYIIAGTGPDESKLKKLINTLELENNIKFLGWKEIYELPKLYNDCDFFLHPSNFDPFPNAILEAMSCGCIVLASSSAGSAIERIIENENGFMFIVGDHLDLANKIIKIMNLNDTEKENIRKKARETAVSWNYKYNIKSLKNILNG